MEGRLSWLLTRLTRWITDGTVAESSYRVSRDMRARMRAFEAVAQVRSTTWGGSMLIA